MKNIPESQKKSNSGVVLLEVLISVLLFSLGVLGLVGLQAVATQNSINSQDRTIASILANDMVSQMWLRNSSTVSSSPISTDITTWKEKVTKSTLSNATGEVTDDAGLATITVQWKAPQKNASDNSNKYVTSVFIPLP